MEQVKYNIEYGITKLMPEKYSRLYKCIPVSINNNKLSIAISEDIAMDNFECVRDYFAGIGIDKLELMKLNVNEISRLINTYYSIELNSKNVENSMNFFRKNRNIEGLYRFIIESANDLGASDIHIMYENDYFIIRLRLKGKLKTLTILDREMGESIIRIIKVNSNIEISKTRSPKDARFKYYYQNQELDIRVSIVSTIENEKVSLRILNPQNIPGNLGELNINAYEENIIRKTLKLNSGFILICGPTGSGKSTTLRCFLNEINDGQKHIVSIEDPIEYTMSGITQIQADDTQTGGFSAALRSIVRQDPDVIYIGEIRDYESADVATKASLTGHLVFSTLHTRSSVSALERIVNIGIDRNTLISSINLVINQRLIGTLCENCKQEIKYEGETIPELKLEPGAVIWEPRGCPKCNYSGYEKNIPMMDIIVFTDELKEKLLRNDIGELKNSDIQEKVKELLKNGKISYKEAVKYLWY